MKKLVQTGAVALMVTHRVWLAAAGFALIGLGSHAACEPVATAIIRLAQRLGMDGANSVARGLTVTWELAADALLAAVAWRARDRVPEASLAATLTFDARQCAQLLVRLRKRWLFWLRPLALVCFVLAGAVSVGRLVGGQAYASLHGISDLFAQLISRTLAFAVPLFVLAVMLLPLVREALFLSVTRTDRAVRIRGRAYSRELLFALPLAPLAVSAAYEAARWARW